MKHKVAVAGLLIGWLAGMMWTSNLLREYPFNVILIIFIVIPVSIFIAISSLIGFWIEKRKSILIYVIIGVLYGLSCFFETQISPLIFSFISFYFLSGFLGGKENIILTAIFLNGISWGLIGGLLGGLITIIKEKIKNA